MQEDLRESSDRHANDLRGMAFQLAETSDRNSYETRSATDPIFRRWRAKVEEELARLRSQGQNVSREQLLYYLVGKAAMEKRNSPEARTVRKAARQRVQRETVRPSNSRSDGAPGGGRQDRDRAARDKRLENQSI